MNAHVGEGWGGHFSFLRPGNSCFFFCCCCFLHFTGYDCSSHCTVRAVNTVMSLPGRRPRGSRRARWRWRASSGCPPSTSRRSGPRTEPGRASSDPSRRPEGGRRVEIIRCHFMAQPTQRAIVTDRQVDRKTMFSSRVKGGRGRGQYIPTFMWVFLANFPRGVIVTSTSGWAMQRRRKEGWMDWIHK